MNEPVNNGSTPGDTERRALLLDPDLFFAVKVSATLKRMGMETTIVRQMSEWTRQLAVGGYSIALVNLAARGVAGNDAISGARLAGLPIIAYGPHSDTEAQAQARTAGASRVIANSKLATDLPRIIEQTLQRAQRTVGQAAAESDSAESPDRTAQDEED